MKLMVNGEAHEVAATTLAELLAALDYGGDWLAPAVNSDARHSTRPSIRVSLWWQTRASRSSSL